MTLLLLADQRVGLDISRWLLRHHRDDVALVVTTADNEIAAAAREAGVPWLVFASPAQVRDWCDKAGIRPDLGVLAWWPTVIRRPLLDLPAHGFVNTHPSLLPHNRGKHYSFWALVEQAPFGVSLHMVTEAVDEGDIIAQLPIAYDWEDTGASLYANAQAAIVELFIATYPTLRAGVIPRTPQDLSRGSAHRAHEMDAVSVIDLDREYRARDLLNLLRARTFPGHPACSFRDEGEEYEVRIDITRKPT